MGTVTMAIRGIRLITPVIGGGVRPLEIDRECPVRPSEIRGQLRYWWRATQDAEDARELFRWEASLWGGPNRRSAVVVRVENVARVRTAPAPSHFKEKLSYVYFAARGTNAQVIEPGMTFDLVLRVPEDRYEEVERAVVLWALLGGVGARTRRGSGSVAVDFPRVEPNPVPIRDVESLVEWVKALPKVTRRKDWPVVKGPGARTVFRRGRGSDPRKEWEEWIDRYRRFRQQRREPCPANPDRRVRQGRTHWPEADAIRLIHGSWLNDRGHAHEPAKGAPIQFPRGCYGLPIVFHFKDHGDPPDYTLTAGDAGDRWASPVILKVTQLPDRQVLRICWVLSTPFPPSFRLEGPNGRDLRPTESPDAFRAGSAFRVGSRRYTDPYKALAEWMKEG